MGLCSVQLAGAGDTSRGRDSWWNLVVQGSRVLESLVLSLAISDLGGRYCWVNECSEITLESTEGGTARGLTLFRGQ